MPKKDWTLTLTTANDDPANGVFKNEDGGRSYSLGGQLQKETSNGKQLFVAFSGAAYTQHVVKETQHEISDERPNLAAIELQAGIAHADDEGHHLAQATLTHYEGSDGMIPTIQRAWHNQLGGRMDLEYEQTGATEYAIATAHQIRISGGGDSYLEPVITLDVASEIGTNSSGLAAALGFSAGNGARHLPRQILTANPEAEPINLTPQGDWNKGDHAMWARAGLHYNPNNRYFTDSSQHKDTVWRVESGVSYAVTDKSAVSVGAYVGENPARGGWNQHGISRAEEVNEVIMPDTPDVTAGLRATYTRQF